MKHEIVMVKTRYEYPSYTDWNRLIDLSGFEQCYVDQIEWRNKDRFHIIGTINGEYRPNRWNPDNGPIETKVAFWSLERPGPEGFAGYGALLRGQLNEWLYDYVWSSDRGVVDLIADSRVWFVPLGGHPDLVPGVHRDVPMKYAVAHLSCNATRRDTLYQAIRDAGLPVAPNGWAGTRDDILSSSYFMLNVHQDSWQIMEPLRLVLGACAKIPILSEKMTDPYPYNRCETGHYIIEAEYEDILSTLDGMLEAPMEEHRARAARCFDLMTTEFGFRRQIELAVARLDSAPLDTVTIR